MYNDFKIKLGIAEYLNKNGNKETIEDTVNNLFERYKDDYIELTNLIMAVNHKSWDCYKIGNNRMSEIYSDLYYKYYEKAISYLEETNNSEGLKYFFRTLD